jgi:hypothetical protein
MALTPQDESELRELLHEHRESRVRIRISTTAPALSKRIGQIGRYLVFVLVAKFTDVLDVVLIPQNFSQAVGEYKQPIANAFRALNEATRDIDLVALLERGRPFSGERSPIGQPMFSITATTTASTTPPPDFHSFNGGYAVSPPPPPPAV